MPSDRSPLAYFGSGRNRSALRLGSQFGRFPAVTGAVEGKPFDPSEFPRAAQDVCGYQRESRGRHVGHLVPAGNRFPCQLLNADDHLDACLRD
jgi:hypothetical protein